MKVTLDEFIRTLIVARGAQDRRNHGVEITLVAYDGRELTGRANAVSFNVPAGIPERIPGLYIVRQKAEGRFYIGSTRCLCKRRSHHVNRALQGEHFNSALLSAFKDDVPASFEFQYFGVFGSADLTATRQILYDFEQQVLDRYAGTPVCWNSGKDVRAARAGKPVSDETRALLSSRLIGRPKSDETRAKMRKAQKGRRPSQYALDRAHESTMKPVSIEGVIYPSLISAARELGLSKATVNRRLRESRYKLPDWKYVDKT